MEPVIRQFILENRADWSRHTAEWYGWRLAPFVRYLDEQCSICDPAHIDYTHVVGFLAHLKDAGASWSTRNGTYTALRQFCTWLRFKNILPVNPFTQSGNGLKRPRKPRQTVKPLKLVHCRAMIKAAEAARDEYGLRDAAMMRLLLTTGIRRAELVALKISDVDFADGEIFITGKGGHERNVYATPETLVALIAWLGVRPKTNDPALFVSLHGHKGKPNSEMRPDAVNDILKSWRDKAGIDPSVSCSPHKWRHTFATEFAAKTQNPFALQELLGHSDISTTRIYVSLSHETLRGLALDNAPEVDDDE